MPIKVPSIVEAQRRGVEIGRLRMGTKVAGGTNGRPVKLSEWRFTSPNRTVIEAAAAKFEGKVEPWASPVGPQFQVSTRAKTIDVRIPPGEPIEQWMEMWSGGGCLRRCTGGPGAINIKNNKPCECPSDDAVRIELAKKGEACKVTTRLRVLIVDLPGIGVWRAETHGYHGTVELASRSEILRQAAEKGVYIPARLRIEPRVKGKFHFMVAVLDIVPSIAEISTGVGVGTLREVSGATPLALTGPIRAALPAPTTPATTPEPSEPDSRAAADFASLANAATTRDELIGITTQAHAAGVIGHPITPGGPPLKEHLGARLAAVTPQPETAAPETDTSPAARAQKYAYAAMMATEHAKVTNLRHHAEKQGLLDEYVSVRDDDAMDQLGDVLDGQLERLAPAI